MTTRPNKLESRSPPFLLHHVEGHDRLLGSAASPDECLRPGVGQAAPWSVVRAENHGFAPAWMPKAARSPLRWTFCCFPPASPTFWLGAGKQKTAPKDRSKQLISIIDPGAGEGIRTLDPNLGKIGCGAEGKTS